MNTRQDFWSRRKQEVEAEAEAEVAELVAQEEQQTAEQQEAKPDAEILQELGLQDPDTMAAGDDFSAFMAKAVPTRLRNRALRKLWLSNPALANLDMLLDYGEDFTKNADMVEVVQTTYQVGKGLLAHVQEMERQEQAKLQAQNEEQNEEPNNEEPETAEELEEHAPTEVLAFADKDADTEVASEAVDECVVVTRDENLEAEADTAFASRKRMRFVFEAQV